MQILNLYRYERSGGGVTTSREIPEGVEYITKYRLIADDGKVLSNGDVTVSCIDVDAIAGWTEIDDPEQELSSEEALSILLGGTI